MEAINYRQITTVPMVFETHGGDDVLIFSSGPFAHLLTGTGSFVHFMGTFGVIENWRHLHVHIYRRCSGSKLHTPRHWLCSLHWARRKVLR